MFAGVTFDHMISIGATCEPAWHFRRTGRYDAKAPFDWLVTPWDSLNAVLDDDGARLGTEMVAAKDGTSVRCSAYDVLYHHEFPRDPGGAVRFSAGLVASCRAKLLHKMQRLRDVCEMPGPVLFVRAGLATDLAWDRLLRESLTATEVNRLVARLRTRFPTLDFRILLIEIAPERPLQIDETLSPLVGMVSLARQTEAGWWLSDQTWDELLRHIDYRPAATPGEPERLYGI
jgi:hypothetical protein